jgi:hypothetical protein
MAVNTLSRRALLEAKRDNDYAPRVKVWPPDGYVAPTAEEFAELRGAARSYATGAAYRSRWERVSDDQVQRHLQLVELMVIRDAPTTKAVYGYARALRDELRRRGLVHRSLAVLRCEACSHATERLFEATQETHLGRTATSAWYCARCWSGYTLGDLADGVPDEDETEDEG